MIKSTRCIIIISLALLFQWESSIAQLTVLGNPYIRDSGMWFELIGRERGNQIIPNEIIVVLSRSGNLTKSILTKLSIFEVERIEVKIPYLIYKVIVNQELDDFECFHIVEQLYQTGLFDKVYFNINTVGTMPVAIDDVTYTFNQKSNHWIMADGNITRFIQMIISNRFNPPFPSWTLKEIYEVKKIQLLLKIPDEPLNFRHYLSPIKNMQLSLYTTSVWRSAKRRSLNSDKTGYILHLRDTLSDTECIEFLVMLYYAGLSYSLEFISSGNVYSDKALQCVFNRGLYVKIGERWWDSGHPPWMSNPTDIDLIHFDTFSQRLPSLDFLTEEEKTLIQMILGGFYLSINADDFECIKFAKKLRRSGLFRYLYFAIYGTAFGKSANNNQLNDHETTRDNLFLSPLDFSNSTVSITTYNLFQNYPNPFNPTTTIRFQTPQAGITSIKVYNILGQEVKTVISEQLPAGAHEVRWDGTDKFNNKVASGIYIYRMETKSGYVKTRKMVYLK